MDEQASSDFSWLEFFTESGIPDKDASDYALLFDDNRVQKDMLLELNKEVLKDMGITMAGDMIAIIRHAKIVHTQELRKTSSTKTAADSGTKAASKRSAINEINEWIKVPGKSQLVKKESYETKQYSDATSAPTATKVSLRGSPELTSGIGLGQWGLNMTKKKKSKMEARSSPPPPQRYEKTGEDHVSRKRSSSDVAEGSQPLNKRVITSQQSDSHRFVKTSPEMEPEGSSVFNRLDQKGRSREIDQPREMDQPRETAHLSGDTAFQPQPDIVDFKEHLQLVALDAVMKCFNKDVDKPTTRQSNPPKQVVTMEPIRPIKTGTFDRLTQINTSRERQEPQSKATRPVTTTPPVKRRIKLRMDFIKEVSNINTNTIEQEQVNVMSRLGKVSVFSRLATN